MQHLPAQIVPLVLCYLEGQTIESAAGVPDCPPATVGTWLAQCGRCCVAGWLCRGFDLSDVTGARTIVAVLSAALVDSIVQAALLGTAEQAAAVGLISESAAALTKGTLPVMSFTKWTKLSMVVSTLSLLGGTASLSHRPRRPVRRHSGLRDCRASGRRRKIPSAVFRWNFRKGESFYQVMKTTTTETTAWVMNAEGVRKSTNDTEKREWTFYFQWTPLEEKDGKWILRQRLIGLCGGCRPQRRNYYLPRGAVQEPIRRSREMTKSPAAQFYKALIGSEFKVNSERGRKGPED